MRILVMQPRQRNAEGEILVMGIVIEEIQEVYQELEVLRETTIAGRN